MTDHGVFLGECFDASQGAPSEFRILRAGDNPTRKGMLVFDDASAAVVLEDYRVGGVDLPLDYDHAMANPDTRPTERKAAGWFKPEVRDGELWATSVRWTPAGRAAVESLEYRYTSLWGDIEDVELADGKAMRLRRLRNVALTNTPATLGVDPLIASEPTEETANMAESVILSLLGADNEAQAVETINRNKATLADVADVLGCSADTVGAAARALVLRAEAGDKAVVELAQVKADAEAKAKRDLVAELSEAGKLPPSLHAWAETQPLESLRAFGAAAPALVQPVSAPADITPPRGPAVELTEDEKHVAKRLGISLDDLAKYKAAQSAKES